MNLNSLIKMIGGTMVRQLVYKTSRKGGMAMAVVMAIVGAVLYVMTSAHR